MGRGKTIIKKGEVQRAARALLAAASDAGIYGDIEVDLVHGLVRFHMTGEPGAGAPSDADADNTDDEWN